MKQFYRNEAFLYWALLIVTVLLMLHDSNSQGTSQHKESRQQTIHTAPVEELFLLHA